VHRPSDADLLAPLLSLGAAGGALPLLRALRRALGCGAALPPALLHALCLYHDPALATALDAACPQWAEPWRGEGGGAPGCVPAWWGDALFSGALRGAGLPPEAALPLWDRALLLLRAGT
jgi:hypothetical protein